MAGQARRGDVFTGICDHGAICCPHYVVGTIVSASSDAQTDGRGQARLGDIGVHS